MHEEVSISLSFLCSVKIFR